MNKSRLIKSWLFLAPIAALFISAPVARANDLAPAAQRDTAAQTPLSGTDFSAQRGNNRRGGGAMGGGNRGGGMRGGGGRGANVGRVGGGRVGNVGRTGRTGRIGNVGRTGRIGRIEGRVGRVGWYYGRYGRYGRYGGRIGYVPPPVVVPGPGLAPGPGIMAPAGPTCAVCPVQQCQVAVYGEQGLQGQSVETRDNQPRLDSTGWQNQIASIIVKGGTWEFYPDLEYRGAPPLRLSPGSYPVLEQRWTKSIGSFLCIK